jgi:ubiquinone/menaquinone biosynthesis C-methylase UbiE
MKTTKDSKQKYSMNTQEYTSMYKVETEHWWYKGLRGALFSWIKNFKPKKILDAGCGTGINMLLLQEKGYEMHGLDASPEAVEFCKKRNLKQVSLGVIENLPYKDSEFDLIYSMDVLGILENKDQEKSIQEFSRCLKKDGILILNVAALQFLYSQHDVACRLLHRFNSSEMNELLIKYNFEIVKSSYRVFFLFPLLALVKFIEKTNIKKNKSEEIKGDLEKTSLILNTLLYPIMVFENMLLKYVSYPIGTSLFVVARKKGSS